MTSNNNNESWIIEYKIPILVFIISLMILSSINLYVSVNSDYQDCLFAKRVAPECIKQECSYVNSFTNPKYYDYMCNLFGDLNRDINSDKEKKS